MDIDHSESYTGGLGHVGAWPRLPSQGNPGAREPRIAPEPLSNTNSNLRVSAFSEDYFAGIAPPSADMGTR